MSSLCTNYHIVYFLAIVGENNKIINDVRGSILQLVSSSGSGIAINTDGTYMGNVVADMQVMIAKAILDEIIPNTPQLQTVGVNSLNSTIIDWASSSEKRLQPNYRCNGDSMHHVVKGMTVIRVEDTVGFDIVDNVVRNVRNLSPKKFDNCYDYHRNSKNIENADDEESLQQGGNIRGISVAAVSGYSNSEVSSLIRGNNIGKFVSDNADVVIGIDIQGRSNSILIEENTIDLNPTIWEDESDPFIALRLLKYSDNQGVSLVNNNFSEEIQILNVVNTAEVTFKGSLPTKKNEWEVGSTPGGGCPFGFK